MNARTNWSGSRWIVIAAQQLSVYTGVAKQADINDSHNIREPRGPNR